MMILSNRMHVYSFYALRPLLGDKKGMGRQVITVIHYFTSSQNLYSINYSLAIYAVKLEMRVQLYTAELKSTADKHNQIYIANIIVH